MVRCLVCALAAPGLAYPLIGLAKELRHRGHEVAFVTGLSARRWAEDASCPCIPRGDTDGDSFGIGGWGNPLRTGIDVKHVEYALGKFTPDVVVTHSLCQAPLLVRERQGIGVAVLGFASYLWPSPSPAAHRGGGVQEALRAWRLHDGVRIFNEARTLCGLRPCAASPRDLPLLGDVFMLRTVPEFHEGLDTLPERVHAVGACLWEPEANEESDEWGPPRAAESDVPSERTLYVQIGRTFGEGGFWRELVDAAGGMPVRVIVSAGRMDAAPRTAPSNFVIRDHVPQGRVLPQAAGVVCDGHSTVLLGALTHGVPLVIVPEGGETPDNAERAARAGSAVAIRSEDVTAELLRRAIERVLVDTQIAAAAGRLREAFARLSGFDHAASLVEALAEGAGHAGAARGARPAHA